ncbi:MAG: hypothetical protein U5R48_03685 [Gammaproteobacteria bacterium]|nr:hypothetical protein [Gammaproteobacteria bacterium]
MNPAEDRRVRIEDPESSHESGTAGMMWRRFSPTRRTMPRAAGFGVVIVPLGIVHITVITTSLY